MLQFWLLLIVGIFYVVAGSVGNIFVALIGTVLLLTVPKLRETHEEAIKENDWPYKWAYCTEIGIGLGGCLILALGVIISATPLIRIGCAMIGIGLVISAIRIEILRRRVIKPEV